MVGVGFELGLVFVFGLEFVLEFVEFGVEVVIEGEWE